MYNSANDFAPFFSEGRLYLPNATVNLLMEAGLDASLGEAALNGLSLDEDRVLIGQISDLLVQILNDLAATHPEAYTQLSSSTTSFMLTGRPATTAH